MRGRGAAGPSPPCAPVWPALLLILSFLPPNPGSLPHLSPQHQPSPFISKSSELTCPEATSSTPAAPGVQDRCADVH